MATIVTQDVTNGDVTDASVMNGNFTAVKTVVNGGIDNANIDASAAIAISKLASYPADASKILYGDGSWAVPTATDTVGYSTTFPGSPTDGQEHIFVDSITVPTYQWRFRYNSGSASAYKWEFVGGSSYYGETDAAASSAAGSGSWSASVTPSMALPRAGDYEIEWGGRGGGNAGGTESYLGLTINSASPGSDYLRTGYSDGTNVMRKRIKLAQSSGHSVALSIQDTDSSRRIAFDSRWISIRPIRCS